jgi:hypothetical protein
MPFERYSYISKKCLQENKDGTENTASIQAREEANKR